MSLRLTRRSLLAGAGAAAAASPFSFSIARSQETPIKIGFPVPLSGPYSSEANDQVRCAQLAIDWFNEGASRKAELVVRDDKLNPGEAATRALELIESDKVDFLCGSLSASVQLSVNQVASKRGVIYNSISQSDTINEASDFTKYTFHEALNPHMTAGAVARYAFKNAKGKKVAYLIADYAYGTEMLRGFRNVAKETGMEEVAEVRHPLGTTDYSTFFPRIQSARPDVLVVVNFGRDQLNTLKQATDFGLKQQMQIVYPVILDTQRFAGGFAPFEDVIGGGNYYWTLEDEHESAKRFNDAYRKKYPDQGVPSAYGALGYAGVYGLLNGVKEAGGAKTDDVIAAMETMKYDAYKGAEYFRKCDHQAVQSVLILKAKAEDKMRDKWDIFEIVDTQPADEQFLRTCEELGHKA
ncbi:ABC transporter substrate-binding protein [Propylenella binzhouense]|uniref:ABC transporter substrate-binding protein n=1 Tax=Propylenella binzhouense TaxID=2555902 RepID=A0A964T887_9HYPH|nr:ABC transporter substrate-binding protein [Propylenella binzhouense]MYZ49589.1 ABC transporter substrate-binding protein [Propylenella binzhouense]